MHLRVIDIKPFSGRRPLFFPLPGPTSIHPFSLLRCADLPRTCSLAALRRAFSTYALLDHRPEIVEEEQQSGGKKNPDRPARTHPNGLPPAREAYPATPSPGDDALVIDALRIASDVQAWTLKPPVFMRDTLHSWAGTGGRPWAG